MSIQQALGNRPHRKLQKGQTQAFPAFALQSLKIDLILDISQEIIQSSLEAVDFVLEISSLLDDGLDLVLEEDQSIYSSATL